jgi:hypothetical protein
VQACTLPDVGTVGTGVRVAGGMTVDVGVGGMGVDVAVALGMAVGVWLP